MNLYTSILTHLHFGKKQYQSILIKSAYEFLTIFLHLICSSWSEQAYSSKLCNNLENKHIGNCGEFYPKRAIFFIKNK
jgi:hypothetical protein